MDPPHGPEVCLSRSGSQGPGLAAGGNRVEPILRAVGREPSWTAFTQFTAGEQHPDARRISLSCLRAPPRLGREVGDPVPGALNCASQVLIPDGTMAERLSLSLEPSVSAASWRMACRAGSLKNPEVSKR